jgi:hypothetical protein
MSVLTSPTGYNLQLGDLVVAMVAAINDKGEGQFSGTNIIGALAETPPQTPPTGPARGILTTETQLDVNWEFLTTYEQTGGTDIISYELDMDDGLGGSFVEVIGYTTPFALNSFLITFDIVSGRNYALKYRAQNVHGWSPDFSPITYILAATVPAIPVGEPQTSIADTEVNVRISWQAPTSTGGTGVVINSYVIEVQLKDGTYQQVCDGTDP